MSPEERRHTIEQFVHGEKYLSGLKYRVRLENNVPQIEIIGISTDQVKSLRKALDEADCEHIRIVKLGQQKKKRRRKRPGIKPGVSPGRGTSDTPATDKD